MNHLLSDISIGPIKGIGKLGENQGDFYSILTLSNFLSNVIGIMTIVAVIWFVFVFILGAIGLITSGGDKNAVETSKKKITTALIGLVIVLLAIVIINLVGFFLGIPDILNIQFAFNRLLNSK